MFYFCASCWYYTVHYFIILSTEVHPVFPDYFLAFDISPFSLFTCGINATNVVCSFYPCFHVYLVASMKYIFQIDKPGEFFTITYSDQSSTVYMLPPFSKR